MEVDETGINQGVRANLGVHDGVEPETCGRNRSIPDRRDAAIANEHMALRQDVACLIHRHDHAIQQETARRIPACRLGTRRRRGEGIDCDHIPQDREQQVREEA